MKSLLILLIGLVLGAAAVVGGYIFLSDRQEGDEIIALTFTEEELQAKIARKFPKEEKVLGIIDIVIDEPKVDLVGLDNRIRFQATATVIVPFVGEEKIGAVFSSSIRYNQKDHTLRTSDYELEELQTDRLPKKYEPTVRTSITAASRELFDDEIVHTIEDKDLEEKLGRLLIQEIRVKNGRLEVSLGL
jgi:hypothetical protein